MKTRLSWLKTYIIFASISLAGCSGNDPITPEVTATSGSSDCFRESLEFESAGGSKVINLTSNVDWTLNVSQIQSSASWCIVSQSGGTSGSFNININVSENTDFDSRNATLVLTAGDLTKNILVKQKQKNTISSTTDSYEVGPEGGTIEVEVKSNVGYNVIIPEDCKEWITDISTRALSTNKISFQIAENNSGESRTGTISFTASDGSESASVKVKQEPFPKVESLIIKLTKSSGTIASNFYIGQNYEFSAIATPENAPTEYEWKVEDGRIASIYGDGSIALLSTKDFGETKIVVTDKISGVSASYDIGTAVTNFRFTENTGKTLYDLPVITMAVGESHQIKYSCTPNYATKVFRNLSAFNFKEINSNNVFSVVKQSTIVDVDENGLMTAKKAGSTIIESNNGHGVHKSGSNDGIYVYVTP